MSAQCEILGVPRSTYYRLRARRGPATASDPFADAVEEELERGSGRYGSRRLEEALARRGTAAGRRRIARAMRQRGLASCHAKARFGPRPGRPDEAGPPDVPGREFDGWAPRTHIVSDLTYVRVRGSWHYVCLLTDLYSREVVGHAASERRGSRLVEAAFATVAFPLCDIEAFHTGRGGEFGNASVGELPGVFGMERSLSKRGCPYDNAVDESTSKTLRAALVWRERFGSLHDLQVRPSDYVWWHSNERMHSTLGYMSPVEFRKAGLSL